MASPGLAWRLLQPHVVRPGRIVTPDLLLTAAAVSGPALAPAPLAVQRILTLPAVQLEPGPWLLAPALAAVRAVETYLLPGLALASGEGVPAWLFLARQALALGDCADPIAVLLDGEAVAVGAPEAPEGRGVVAAIRLGAARPAAGATAVRVCARAGPLLLPETRVALEWLA